MRVRQGREGLGGIMAIQGTEENLKQKKNNKKIAVKLIPENRVDKMLHQEIRTA